MTPNTPQDSQTLTAGEREYFGIWYNGHVAPTCMFGTRDAAESYWRDEMGEDGTGAYEVRPLSVLINPHQTQRAVTVSDSELIDELLDIQQDINVAANSYMDQSLCNASAFIDKIEPILRAALNQGQG